MACRVAHPNILRPARQIFDQSRRLTRRDAQGVRRLLRRQPVQLGRCRGGAKDLARRRDMPAPRIVLGRDRNANAARL
jgi:hypothetical protein